MATKKPWWDRNGGWQYYGNLYKMNGDDWGIIFINKDKKSQELRFAREEEAGNPDDDSPVFKTIGAMTGYIRERLGYDVAPDSISAKYLK